jgi:hypothetical protein
MRNGGAGLGLTLVSTALIAVTVYALVAIILGWF